MPLASCFQEISKGKSKINHCPQLVHKSFQSVDHDANILPSFINNELLSLLFCFIYQRNERCTVYLMTESLLQFVSKPNDILRAVCAFSRGNCEVIFSSFQFAIFMDFLLMHKFFVLR